MEETAKLVVAPENKERDSLITRILKVAAFPVAGISGLWVTSNDLHTSAFSKAKSVSGNPHFGPIADKYRNEYIANAQAFEAKLPGSSQAEFLAKELEIKTRQSMEVGAKLEEMGFGHRYFGLKDLGNKWRYVNRGSRQQALINGMTVAGITVGAILSVSSSKLLDNVFSNDKGDTEKNR